MTDTVQIGASQMQIEDVEIKKLIPYERNAKKHDETQIKNVMESIKQFGFAQPLVVDKDNVVIIGHCRLIAAKRLKKKTVPVLRMEKLTQDQVDKLRLLDNKLNESDWDMDILTEDIPQLDFSDFDIDWGLGEDEKEEDIQIIEDEIPEPPKIPTTKSGQIFKLGNHRLICGDSTNADDIKRLMDNKKAAITFTSPPYNVGESSSLNGNTHMKDSKYIGSDDNLVNYDDLLNKSTQNAIKNSKFAFINLQMLANNKIILCEYLNAFKDKLCDIAIWVKNSTAPAMARRVMNSQFEFIYIFSEENNSRAIGTNDFRGTVSNVYNGNAQRNNEYSSIHSATFPMEFPAHFIKNFTNKGDQVLDTFGGTGTTLIVCEQLERCCYMCEIDPRYCDVIIERWEKFTGQKAELIGDANEKNNES